MNSNVDVLIKNEKLGKDLRELILENEIYISEDLDLREYILPKDKTFFIKLKRYEYIKLFLPKIDMNSYEFDGVDISNVVFSKDTILPLDEKFFENTPSGLVNSVMPVGDYSIYSFKNVNINFCDFKNATKFSKNFFKECTSNEKAEFSSLDFNDYDLEGANFAKVIFEGDCVLPRDRDFLQKIKDKSLELTKLPRGDYRKYHFNGVYLRGTSFTEDSVFSDNPDVFVSLKNKDIQDTVLPKGNYFSYVFKGVITNGVSFTRDSILPEYDDFIMDIYKSNVYYDSTTCLDEKTFRFTDNVVKRLHFYNLSLMTIDLTPYADLLTEKQLSVIRARNRDIDSKRIIFPKLASEERLSSDFFEIEM